MTEIRIRKSKIYIFGIIFLVLLGSFFMLKGGNNVNAKTLDSNSDFDVQKVVISMNNYNYYPNTVTVKEGKPVSISLDESVFGCFRDFTIRDLGIREYLKTPQDTLVFTPTKKGTYTFACSMGMGTGKIIVE